MTLLTKAEIQKRLAEAGPSRIFIDPLLEPSQIGAVSVDLRLGTDFMVSVVNQRASIILHPPELLAGPDTFFQSARRDVGDRFLIHPGQTVLATSLEYLGLPADVYADVFTRSSYHRLGISISSMFQPGFRGCASLELFNHSNVSVELIVGSRIVQARFFKIETNQEYYGLGVRRKYIGNVRPTVSKAQADEDLGHLSRYASR